jgi:hypothetical protein
MGISSPSAHWMIRPGARFVRPVLDMQAKNAEGNPASDRIPFGDCDGAESDERGLRSDMQPIGFSGAPPPSFAYSKNPAIIMKSLPGTR